MSGRKLLAVAAMLLPVTASAQGLVRWTDFAEFEVDRPITATPEQLAWTEACDPFDDWDKPGPPFMIAEDTYYVGTCGISSILITNEEGHFLIDGGTEAGAEVIASNIAALGFDIADVRVLLMSHEHFDHVGGLARLQELSGAPVYATEAAAAVLRTGEVAEDDPQYGLIEGFAPVEVTVVSPDDMTVSLGGLGVNVIPTPGHTAGATSYNWMACTEDYSCRFIVYADSLSAVSRDDYRFSDHPDLVATFRASFGRIGETPCSILLTPHPSSSQWHERVANGTVVHPLTCPIYRNRLNRNLDARLAREEAE